MNSVVLTEQEFKDAYNARVYLFHAINNLAEVLAPSYTKELNRIYNLLDKALHRPTEERDNEFDRRRKLYEQYKMPNSVWSMYEVANLEDNHPYTAQKLVYEGWSQDISTCKTWYDLWCKADELIFDSGDEHHIFIEGFHQSGDTLKLQTGS